MKPFSHLLGVTVLLLLATVLSACSQQPEEESVAGEIVGTTEFAPTVTPIPTRNRDFVVIATDAPLPPFTRFDEFGTIEGFNTAVMENIAAQAGFEYEFVVTPHQGVLDVLASGESTDFDAVMSSLLVPETPQEGIVYTIPYLDVGQVLVVLADENELQRPEDLRSGQVVGVQNGSQGAETARQILGVNENDLLDQYEEPNQVVQALIDETVRAIVIDSHSAEYFVEAFPLQLKTISGEGEAGWISRKSYGIAVAANNPNLLERLNDAISQLQDDQVIDRLTVAWLILDDLQAEEIQAGESRVGTPAGEFFIGMIGQLDELEPADSTSDFISWEVKNNTMSGLYMFDAQNELQPILAADFPTISEDKLEYTITLREGLQFPDGSDFTAEDVRWSIIRSSRLGNFIVNSYLKDSNEDNFADTDSVQVIDAATVKIVLQEPTAYFPSLLATPPFYPISNECYAETADPSSTCGGIGPYNIISWTPGDRIRLKANPQWPGRPTPAFENIIVRFYDEAEDMRNSLTEFQSIDLAWLGLPYVDFVALRNEDLDADGNGDIVPWTGPASFKSYIIFEQEQSPWDNQKVRQAVSLALNREAISQNVFAGNRLPLYSPVPDQVPGHLATLPQTDIEQVQSLMLEVGYTEQNPLEIEFWFVNDGRYSVLEEQYLSTIGEQLEATGVFSVTISGAPWDQFRVQIAECAYPAYLLGWPSPGQPVSHLDPSSWIDFFVEETDRIFCSHYESAAMDALLEAARQETDPEARMGIYGQIQELWAEDLPTLDITQQPQRALSLAKVEGVAIDAMGLLHYQLLSKSGG